MQSGPSVIEASSALSQQGNVEVEAVNVDGSGLLAAAEIDPLDVEQWQELPCNLRQGKTSRLIMAGYDAHPTPVDDLLSSLPLYTMMPLAFYEPTTRPKQPNASTAEPIQPMTIQHSDQLAAAGTANGCTL